MALQVRVRNFQSLEDVTLTIDGFTVVTGTNNAGKSALFRAIQGVFTNRTGTNFVRHGAKHCTVDLTFDDGQTLTWEKGSKVNRYVVNGKVFDNVGHGVPPEVAAFGVTAVTLNDDKYWPQIAPQIRGVNFLLDKPGSVLAEAVADVERVNQLNRALKFCESDRKKARADLRVRRSDAEDLANKLAHYQGLEDVVDIVEQMAARRTKAVKMRDAHALLETLRAQWADATAAVESLSGVEKLSVSPDDHIERLRTLKTNREATQRIKGRLLAAQRDLTSAEKLKSDLDQISFEEAQVSKLEKIRAVMAEVRGIKRRLLAAQKTCNDLDRQVTDAADQHRKAHDLVHELLGGMEECPACGKSV